ncbi:MAG: glycosyltransferase family 2 protein [Clostridia bacterium]|nr:glycosyltransferase family 2 protein [Clostridia bacterium]
MAEKKLITVFTPTYNRCELLCNCFNSLMRQTSHNFIWIIVDDGSTDDTAENVRKWTEIARGVFDIKYISKSRGGLHTAYNTALETADTELFVCVDDDDFLIDSAIEKIAVFWQEHGSDNVAGIVALNRTPEKKILGNPLPELSMAHITELRCKYKCKNDLKMIYRTSVLADEAPIPVYDGELYLNPYYLFLKADKKLPMLLMNVPVCVVNYQPDGLSTYIIRQYRESPNSFAELRLMMMSMPYASFSFIMRNAVHYVSSVIFAHRKKILIPVKHKAAVIAAAIPGVALNILIRIIYRKKYGKFKK